jgi:hypothetical protein
VLRPPERGPRELRLPDDASLSAWVAALAVDEAARERSRAAWLRREAEEEGTLAGVLTDLCERRASVAVVRRDGRTRHGRLVLVAADFVVVAVGSSRRSGGAAPEVLVARAAIAAVRTVPGEASTAGDRADARIGRSDVRLSEVVASLAAERARVRVESEGAASAVAGELRACGQDVATVRLDGDGGTAYVALDSLCELSLVESG